MLIFHQFLLCFRALGYFMLKLCDANCTFKWGPKWLQLVNPIYASMLCRFLIEIGSPNRPKINQKSVKKIQHQTSSKFLGRFWRGLGGWWGRKKGVPGMSTSLLGEKLFKFCGSSAVLRSSWGALGASWANVCRFGSIFIWFLIDSWSNFVKNWSVDVVFVLCLLLRFYYYVSCFVIIIII